MIQHPDKNFIDPIPIGICKKPAYYAHVEEGFDGNPQFHDIKENLEKGEYPKNATHTQKRTFQRLASHFFQSRGTLYKRTIDLGLLQCVGAKEASRLLEEIHAGTCEPHMNDFILAKKIFRAGIKHQNSTAYMPQMNGTVEAAYKNIKKILRKIVDNYKQWHEKLPFALFGYYTTVCASTGETPYLHFYGTEVVIPAEVEIPSLRIIQEVELSDAEWVGIRYKQLDLIDGKRMNAVCHGQLYHNIIVRAFNKKVRSRQFTPGAIGVEANLPTSG
ncbi:uncharacterized protein [Nicotiana tomentosiformis]|uniref:uncharacterized protein n=1 Tax=Nicotiana tomentosiformis TaxID=4098 RepID=UPI00388C57D6